MFALMALLPGFEYDIFISYRHNDNRSGGITEFVNLLKVELAATIKEPVSVYFDANAHDGLRENHHVDKSLEGKLKCLILLPVISQTYCDPKSFAWQHEFVAFNKLAQSDELGRDIKLNNGNVASRILPIKIHDLDAADKTMIESELGGALRSIEFIYKEPGVNRPLKISDKKEDNQNHTDYGNQVNKVANAIKEIIYAIKFPGQPNAISLPGERVQPARPRVKKIAIVTLCLLLLSVTGYFLYSKFIQPSDEGELSKSIAVLPFENRSGEEDAYFTTGVTEDILTQISKIGDLRVLSRFTLKDYDSKGKTIQQIGAELGVGYILTGSIRRAGNNLRISCQLVQVNPEKETWAENFDKHLDDVFAIQHDVAIQVANHLKTKFSSGQENGVNKPTDNLAAYNYYLKGRVEYDKYEPEANKAAISHFKEALVLDPDFVLAQAGLADAYSQATLGFGFLPMSYNDTAMLIAKKATALNSKSPEAWKALGMAYHVKGLYDEAIDKYKKAIEFNPGYEPALINLSSILAKEKGQFDEAITLQKQVIHNNPLQFKAYSILGSYYVQLSMYPEAEKYLKRTLQINPRDINGYYISVQLYYLTNQPQKAQQHLKDMVAIDPDDAFINENAADAALNFDPQLAKVYLQKSIRAKGFDAQTNYTVPVGMGYVLWQEGKIDSAKTWLDPSLAYHLELAKSADEEGNILMIVSNYAVRGEKKEALRWLRKLVDLGYSDRNNLLADFRLSSLRKEPEFIKITEDLDKKLTDMRLKVSAQENKVTNF